MSGRRRTILAATRAELDRVGQAESPLGTLALALAARLDRSGGDAGSAVAALAKELRQTLADATRGVGSTMVDPVDELKKRREVRHHG